MWKKFTEFKAASRLTDNILGGSRVQQQSNNQAVQTQDFSENQDQKHTHEQSWLLSGTSDTSVTNNTNGKTSSQTGQTDRQTGTQLDETGVQGLGLLQGVGHQHGDDQTINGDNTSQNDWHNVLKQQVWSQDTGGTHTDTRLSGSVRGTETGEYDGCGTSNGTKEGSVDWAELVSSKVEKCEPSATKLVMETASRVATRRKQIIGGFVIDYPRK